MIYWLALFLALFLNAFSNIAVKIGAIKSSKLFILAGLVGFGVQFLFYAFALKKIDLSIAYPIMVGSGFVVISLFSYFYLKEHINVYDFVGMFLIFTGVLLISIR